jgi:hypothetical protein
MLALWQRRYAAAILDKRRSAGMVTLMAVSPSFSSAARLTSVVLARWQRHGALDTRDPGRGVLWRGIWTALMPDWMHQTSFRRKLEASQSLQVRSPCCDVQVFRCMLRHWTKGTQKVHNGLCGALNDALQCACTVLRHLHVIIAEHCMLTSSAAVSARPAVL